MPTGNFTKLDNVLQKAMMMRKERETKKSFENYNDHLHRCIKVEVVVRNIYNRVELVNCIKKALTKKGYDGIYTLFVTESEGE